MNFIESRLLRTEYAYMILVLILLLHYCCIHNGTLSCNVSNTVLPEASNQSMQKTFTDVDAMLDRLRPYIPSDELTVSDVSLEMAAGCQVSIYGFVR